MVFVTSGYNNVNDPVKLGMDQGICTSWRPRPEDSLQDWHRRRSSTNVSGLAHISALLGRNPAG